MPIDGTEPVSAADLNIALGGASSSDIGDAPVSVDDLKMAVEAIKGKYEEALDCYWFGTERLYGIGRALYGYGVGCRLQSDSVIVPSAGKYSIVACLTGVAGMTSSSSDVGIYLTYNGSEHQLYRGSDINLSNMNNDSWSYQVTADLSANSSVKFEFRVIASNGGSIKTRLKSLGVVRIA